MYLNLCFCVDFDVIYGHIEIIFRANNAEYLIEPVSKRSDLDIYFVDFFFGG